MQKRNSIVNIPLVSGVVLSIAVHAVALYSRGIYMPPEPQLDSGQTVVQLTLLPSAASTAAPVEPEPIQEPQPESVVIPVAPIPVPVPEPMPQPVAEKTVEPDPEPEPMVDPVPEQVESKEQIASMIEDKGVITDASPIAGIRPTYPRSSQKRHHEGTVQLSIQVLKNGKAGSVKVLSSSGHKRLDEAAVKAAKAASYKPAEQFGRPIDSHSTQSVVFKLTQ